MRQKKKLRNSPKNVRAIKTIINTRTLIQNQAELLELVEFEACIYDKA